MQRAYAAFDLQTFQSMDNNAILGQLSKNHAHDLNPLQRNAWIIQTEILKSGLKGFSDGKIYYEFAIPRMGKRVDNVLFYQGKVFVLEFKVGAREYHGQDIDQVVDYAFDLKNFHEGTHHLEVIPILIATEANGTPYQFGELKDQVHRTILANKENFQHYIQQVALRKNIAAISPRVWENSLYKPTPTIIEAAQALYKGHNVKEISRSDAGAINLSQTTTCLNEIIDDAKENCKKVICFVTGVPGAGKTLAGLNIATERMRIDEGEHAVFLSGNGPLVEVLREALARDLVKIEKDFALVKGVKEKISKKDAERKVKTFIQNIHHFRDDGLQSQQAPEEKVVVFDEAQRAWTKEQASAFMKTKRGKSDFDASEPEFLLEVMDRHENWCVVVCLIGGGQEINTGEAGLEEWFLALQNKFSYWSFYYSNLIVKDPNYLKKEKTIQWVRDHGIERSALHLAVSVRSFRSEKLAEFVEHLLMIRPLEAKKIFNVLSEQYPIFLTRDLSKAKEWIMKEANGTERFGIVASSGAKRLRAKGVDVKNIIKPSHWFLNDKKDVRSSYFLEEIATEFDIQGLELDWTIVAWGGDLYFDQGKWNHQSFKGSKWQQIRKDIKQEYLLNAYRVILTRARQGMVIYIPEGSDKDATRPKKYYDTTYQYLRDIGIKEV